MISIFLIFDEDGVVSDVCTSEEAAIKEAAFWEGTYREVEVAPTAQGIRDLAYQYLVVGD